MVDPFIVEFQQSMIALFVPQPTLNQNPTLRVTIGRPEKSDLDITLLPPNLDLTRCIVFCFELFDTQGHKAPIPTNPDGSFRAYHCTFEDDTYQMLFDDLPSFDGTSSKCTDYANTAVRFIYQQLVH